MEKKKIITTFALILVLVALGMFIFNPSDNNSEEDEFCLTSEPIYKLDCEMDNETVSVKANEQNVDKAVEKNNCTVAGRHDKLDIIYCNQESNLTKYRISTEPYSE